jgi:hypothetical protein
MGTIGMMDDAHPRPFQSDCQHLSARRPERIRKPGWVTLQLGPHVAAVDDARASPIKAIFAGNLNGELWP